MALIQRRHLSVVLACAVSSVVLLLVATTQAATEPSVGTTILYREWYTGDGLGVNITLYLQDDYIYRATWDGCLGRYGSASGTWSRTGDIVDLAPDREDGMLEEFLIKLQLVSTPDDPRLRLLQQHDNGDWTPRPAFDFEPVGVSPQEDPTTNTGGRPTPRSSGRLVPLLTSRTVGRQKRHPLQGLRGLGNL